MCLLPYPERLGDWSDMNCTLVNNTETMATCECTHFTNFAILLVRADMSSLPHSLFHAILPSTGPTAHSANRQPRGGRNLPDCSVVHWCYYFHHLPDCDCYHLPCFKVSLLTPAIATFRPLPAQETPDFGSRATSLESLLWTPGHLHPVHNLPASHAQRVRVCGGWGPAPLLPAGQLLPDGCGVHQPVCEAGDCVGHSSHHQEQIRAQGCTHFME